MRTRSGRCGRPSRSATDPRPSPASAGAWDRSRKRRVSHSGGLPGFISQYWRFPDDRLSIIVLINLDDADVGTIMALAQRYLE